MERKSSKENTMANTALDNIIQMKWKQNDRPNNVKKSSTESTTATDYREEMKEYKIVFLVHESVYDSWTPVKESDRPSKEEPYFRYVHPSDKRAIYFYEDPMKELSKMPRRSDEHSASSDAAIESSLDPNVPAFVPLSSDDTSVTNTVNSTQTSVAATAPKRRPGICLNRKPFEVSPDTGESSAAPPSTTPRTNKTSADIEKLELLDRIDQDRLHSLTNYETEIPGNPSDGILMNNLKEDVQDVRFAPTESDAKAKNFSFSSSAISALPTALVQPSKMNMHKPMAEYQMDFDSNIPLKSTLPPYSVPEVPQSQVPQPYSVQYNKNEMPTMEQDGQPFYRSPPPLSSQSGPEPLNRHPSSFSANPSRIPYSMENEYSPQQVSPVGQLASDQQNHRQLSSMSNQNQMHSMESNYSYQKTPIVGQLPRELPNYRQTNSMSNQNCSYEPSYQQTPQVSQLASEMHHYRLPNSIPHQDRIHSIENERSLPLTGQLAPELQNYHQQNSISHQNHEFPHQDRIHSMENERPLPLTGQLAPELQNYQPNSISPQNQEYSRQYLPPATRTASEARNHYQPSSMSNQNCTYEQSRQQSPPQVCQLSSRPQNYCQSSSISNQDQMYVMENNQSLRQAPLADQLAPKPQNYHRPNSIPRQNHEYSNQYTPASEARNYRHLNSVSNYDQMYSGDNDQSYQQAFASDLRNHCQPVSARNQICMDNDLSYQPRLPQRQLASDTHNRSQPFFTSNEDRMPMMGQDAEFQQASSVCQMASQLPNYPQSRSVPSQIQTLVMEQNQDFHYPPPLECQPSPPPPPVSMMQDQGAASHYQPSVSMPVPNEEYRSRIDAIVEDSSGDSPISIAQLTKIISDSQLPENQTTFPYPRGKNHTEIPEEQYQAPEINRSPSPWYFQQSVNNQQMMQEQSNQCGVSFSSDR